MKKLLIFVFVLLLISVAACKKTVKQDVMEKKPVAQQPAADAAVDSIENDLNSVDAVEQDLNTDELNDIDSGLSEIENI